MAGTMYKIVTMPVFSSTLTQQHDVANPIYFVEFDVLRGLLAEIYPTGGINETVNGYNQAI